MLPLSRLACSALVVVGSASAAQAQCLAWSKQFYAPADQAVEGPFIVFDKDGPGPAHAELYAAGVYNSFSGPCCPAVSRWDGHGWTALPGNFTGQVLSFAVWDDDGPGPHEEALYAGGNFTTIDGQSRPLVARFDGANWTAVGNLDPNNGRVEALVAVPFGLAAPQIAGLYAAGHIETSVGVAPNVMRFDGTSWAPVGAGLGQFNNDTVHALTLLTPAAGASIGLYAGGSFTMSGTLSTQHVALWNGLQWSAVGGGTDDDVLSLAAFPENGGAPVLIAGGLFHNAGGAPAERIARWNGSAWSAIQGGLYGSSSGPGSALISFDEDGAGPLPPELFVGGNFTGVVDDHGTHIPSNYAARWDGTTWSSLGNDLYSPVRAFGKFDDGNGERVYVSAGVNLYPSFGSPPTALMWTGTRWKALGDGMSVIGGVSALVVWDDDGAGPHPLSLFAGGDFDHAGDTPADRLARWDGASWNAVNNGLGSPVSALIPFDEDGPGPQTEKLWVGGLFGLATWDGTTSQLLFNLTGGDSISVFAAFDAGAGAGPELYAGGTLNLSGGSHIRRWDGSTLAPVGRGLTPHGNAVPVRAMAVFDEDGAGPLAPALFIGGSIADATQTSTGQGGPGGTVHLSNNLVRWDGSVWSAVGSLHTTDVVNDLAVFDFDGSGPSPARLCVAFDSSVQVWDGQNFTPLGTGFSATNKLAVFDDGSGSGPALFVSADAQLFKWTGSVWQPCGGTSGPFEALVPYQDPTTGESALFAGGSFSAVDQFTSPSPAQIASSSIAAWTGCTMSGSPFCMGDGSGTACPCGNTSHSGDTAGCLNSLGLGGKLVSGGTPSLMHDSLYLLGSQMPSSSSLYFQGATNVNSGAGGVFGDGLRCATGSVIRLATRTNVGGASAYPLPGEPSISQKGSITSPGARRYQVWYRNAANFCTAATYNLTNGWTVNWTM